MAVAGSYPCLDAHNTRSSRPARSAWLRLISQWATIDLFEITRPSHRSLWWCPGAWAIPNVVSDHRNGGAIALRAPSVSHGATIFSPPGPPMT